MNITLLGKTNFFKYVCCKRLMEVKKHFKNVIIQHCNGTIGCSISAALLKSPSLSLPPLCSCVALMWKFWLWYYGIITRTVCFFVYFSPLFFFFPSWLLQEHLGDLCQYTPKCSRDNLYHCVS